MIRGSNTTYPNEMNATLIEFTSDEQDAVGIETWPIDRCIEANILNGTQYSENSSVYLYNGTQVRCLPHMPTKNVVQGCVLSVIAVLSFIGNIATIISLKRRRCRGRARPSWTAIYSLIYQLSIADLLVTIFCITGDAIWAFTLQWYAGDVGCKLYKLSQMFALNLSTFILVLIGVDRWLAVKYPMKSMGTASRSGKLVMVAWIFSFVLSIPQAFVFRVLKGPFYEEFHQCVTFGFYTARWQEQLYTTLSLVFMFILPLIILISTYVSTVRTIAQSEKVFKPEVLRQAPYLKPDSNRRRLIDKAKMKSLRISVVIVAAFFVWWTPYHVMMIIFMFFEPDNVQAEKLHSVIFFFGMSNSLVNPVIYGAFHLWPKKKKNRDGEPASFRRGDQSSVRLTTVRSLRSSANGHNTSLL